MRQIVYFGERNRKGKALKEAAKCKDNRRKNKRKKRALPRHQNTCSFSTNPTASCSADVVMYEAVDTQQPSTSSRLPFPALNFSVPFTLPILVVLPLERFHSRSFSDYTLIEFLFRSTPTIYYLLGKNTCTVLPQYCTAMHVNGYARSCTAECTVGHGKAREWYGRHGYACQGKVHFNVWGGK
jgi:hypothetical protein